MNIEQSLKTVSSFAMLILIAACTSVPITSFPKLAALDPETMDLRDVELAVRVQDDFGIKPQSVVLNVSLIHDDTGDGISEQFVLSEDTRPLTKTLNGKLKTGFTIHRYRISEEVGEKIMIYRDQVVEMRNAEEGDQHEGTFSAKVELCMQPDGNPFIDPRMTLFFRPSAKNDFFTMFKETKLPVPRDEQHQAKLCEAK